MSSWSFGQPAVASAPAFGSGFGAGTSVAAPAVGGGFFGGLGTSTAAIKPSGGFSGFGTLGAAAAVPSFFPTASSAAAPAATSIFGAVAPSTTYSFPTKSAEKGASSGSLTQASTSTSVYKAGSTGKKPKENILQEQLVSDVWELEKKILKYQKIQSEAADYSLQDALEWDSAMKRFDSSATRVKNQLVDTFTTIDHLRKNTARLRSQNLLSSRLSNNPAAYYSVASSVESYFTEVVSGLRTELEIFEEELLHLENLHDDLIRPGDRFNLLDLQQAYMYLSKMVNGVAVSVEEVAKVGDELRREIQATKGITVPIPAPQQPFLGQDLSQLASARSLFSASPAGPSSSIFGNATPSKSPLLQPMSPEIQSAMFNPAMRTLTRMDSTSGLSSGAPASPQMSRLNQSYFLGAGGSSAF